jgi:osmotically-inducible protein OsmY
VRRIDNHLKVSVFATPHWEPRIDEWDPQRYPWFERPKQATADDAAIEAEIRRELTWSPFVDGDDVRVTVRDGVAILDGTVDSPEERAAATENAYEGGAVRVVNRLNARIDL